MRWLHLSDLHFMFNGYDSAQLKNKLLDKIEELKLNLDFIIITGDCLYQYKEKDNDIKRIADFIISIAKKSNCSKKNIFLCQGNHDVSRNDITRNQSIKKYRKNKKDFYDELSSQANEKFRILYKAITGKDYESYKVFQGRNKPYRIISINTGLLSVDDRDKEKLRVCDTKLNELGKDIKDDNKLNILIMHHGTEWLNREDERKFVHWMDDNSIDIVFSGHTHLSAAITYDDTYRSIMQFTAGGIIQDGYALPSFYICESDQTSIDLNLFTYSKDTGSWEIGNQQLRKFKNGRFHYCIRRLTEKLGEDKDIINIRRLFEKYDGLYKEKFNSESIYANKYSGYETFDSWKITHSLIEIGLSFKTALQITSCVMRIITSDQFDITETSDMSCSVLRKVIYEAILNYKSNDNDSEVEISKWASTYARKYNREEEITVLDGEISKKLNYQYLKDEILKEVMDNVTGSSVFYMKTSKHEIANVATNILSFVKRLNIIEINKSALVEIVKEYITQKPHPWVISDDNREEIIAYHLRESRVLISNIKKKNASTDYSIQAYEAIYHICASILAKYDNYIGSTELSPLKILNKSIKYVYEGAHKPPVMQMFQIVQLRKDIDLVGGTIKIFTDYLDTLLDNITKHCSISLPSTKEALLGLWEYTKKLNELENEKFNSMQADSLQLLRDVFSKAKGFMIKANLQGLKNAFWVEPNWEYHETDQQHLDDQLLVCVLSNNALKESIKEVCNYLRTKENSSTEIVFAKSDLEEFSPAERTELRGTLKKSNQRKRCIFIQKRDFTNIEKLGWRKEFYRIVCISKYSL